MLVTARRYGVPTGTFLNQLPDKPLDLHIQGVAHSPWRRMVAWAVLVAGLAALLGAHLPVASGFVGGVVVEAAGTPAFVFHDIQSPGEPREEQHRETPAKKARLTALKVLTQRSAGQPQGTAFHLQTSPAPSDTGSQASLSRLDAQGAPLRTDPALSLHHGQAPPAA